LQITSVGREEGRPIVRSDPDAALRWRELSPYAIRAIGESVYAIDKLVSDDRETVQLLLKWAERLIGGVERRKRLVSAS
jgi:hypothetical protein